MEQRPTPEFGPNGAVLNSATMTEALKQEYLGEALPRKATWPRRINWVERVGLMIPVLPVWLTPAGVSPAPLWLKLAITAAAGAFFIRSFWPFDRNAYRRWGALYVLGLMTNLIVLYTSWPLWQP